MEIYDNFLNKKWHEEILDLMGAPNFIWYYGKNITGPPSPDGKSHERGNDIVGDLDEHGFSHPFFVNHFPPQSDHTAFIMPFLYKIMDKIGANELLRSRGDMTVYSAKGFQHEKHIDFEYPNISTIYYVNDSEGNTVGEDWEVEPKANRLAVYPGNVMHTGHSPMKHKTRICINSNFRKN